MESGNVHKGHRQRMRSKLVSFGPKIFDTYELLEMLLYTTVPYRDTNPTAKALLTKFGGLDAVLRAPTEELITVSGIGARTAALLRAVGRISEIIGLESFPRNIPVLKNYYQVGDYLVDLFRDADGPAVYVLLLDNEYHPIACERLYDLSYGSAGVKPKSFVDAVLRHGASACFTIQHRPHGSVYPTLSDRETDKAVVYALTAAGIDRVNHYVIAGELFHGIDYVERERAGVRANDHYGVNSICRVVPHLLPQKKNTLGRERLTELLSCVMPEPSELVDRLLSRYPTVEYMLTPTVRELSDIAGEQTAMLLKLAAYVISRSRTDRFRFGTKHTDKEIASYLTGLYIGTSVETISMLTLDSSDRVTSCRIVAEGTVNSAVAVPRSFLEIAGEMRARSVIIAHNHPLGNTAPSNSDRGFTAELLEMFNSTGISLLAHYIVAGQSAERMNLSELE